jgi:hypothetical protein
MKTYGRVEVQLHAFFTFILNADEWQKLAAAHTFNLKAFLFRVFMAVVI